MDRSFETGPVQDAQVRSGPVRSGPVRSPVRDRSGSRDRQNIDEHSSTNSGANSFIIRKLVHHPGLRVQSGKHVFFKEGVMSFPNMETWLCSFSHRQLKYEGRVLYNNIHCKDKAKQKQEQKHAG